MSWLVGTLVWTGVLIAVVLLVRRPVARQFGAHAAYALWALPLLRLALPPIVLPSWLAPAREAAGAAATIAPAGAPISTVTVVIPPPEATPTSPVDWSLVLVAIWFAGSLAYVAVRLIAYARLRESLLAGARSVGEVGHVRLVETRATASPLAFGVLDKVIALPPHFMAQPDRAARDLALEHELAHHRAHDLAANFAALPLFALHWFNPLSWLGWHAMRRDQEAACDARVIRNRDRAERALYASVIAGTAAAPRGGLTAALAAPMACPVLGEKSIIHRLRTMTMTDHSDRRRRAGSLLVGAAALALPLTASISYAADVAPPAPVSPAAPLPPAAPDAPPLPARADAPLAPEAPTMSASDSRVVVEQTSPDGRKHERQVRIFRTGDGSPHLAPVPPTPPAPGAAPAPAAPPRIERKIVMRGRDGQVIAPDSPEFEAQMQHLEKQMEGLDERIERSMEMTQKRVAIATARAGEAGRMAERMAARAPRVVDSCAGREQVSESSTPDGKRVIRICSGRIAASALAGLRSARASIARNTDMSDSVRAQVLASLDREIARVEAGK